MEGRRRKQGANRTNFTKNRDWSNWSRVTMVVTRLSPSRDWDPSKSVGWNRSEEIWRAQGRRGVIRPKIANDIFSILIFEAKNQGSEGRDIRAGYLPKYSSLPHLSAGERGRIHRLPNDDFIRSIISPSTIVLRWFKKLETEIEISNRSEIGKDIIFRSIEIGR